MSRILLLNEAKDQTYSKLVSQLSTLEDVWIKEAKDVLELESQLKQHPIQLLLLILDQAPSDPLLHCISKSKNIAGFRDAHFISVHKRFLDSGIQKALMAGAKSIYLEPIDQDRIVQGVKSLFDGSLTPSSILPVFTKITPVSCQVEVFGRIGKLFLDPVGDLQVEIDTKLTYGQEIKIRSLIAKDQGHSEFKYSVLTATKEDTYYHYLNSYHLSWQASPEMRKDFLKWIKSNQNSFALPKTKVLWITESPLGAPEAAVNKTLFSLHVQIPGKVTHSYLRQLNPRIVIAEQLPEASLKSVRDWADEKRNNKILLISTTSDCPPSWYYISHENAEQFSKMFIDVVKPYLSERITHSIHHAKYLDRKSNYSRFTLSLEGKVISIEKSHLTLELEKELEQNTVFYMSCPSYHGQDHFGLYLKVLKVELQPHSSLFHSICEIIPISDQPELFLAKWFNWVQAQTQAHAPSQIHTQTKAHAPMQEQSEVPLHVQFQAQLQAQLIPSTKIQAQNYSINAVKSNRRDASEHLELFFLDPDSPIRLSGFWLDLLKILIAIAICVIIFTLLYFILPHSPDLGVTPATMQEVFRGIRDAFK